MQKHRVYIAPSFRSRNGIAHYAKDFFELVLRDLEFSAEHFDSVDKGISWIEKNYPSSGAAYFHIETGSSTPVENAIMKHLLKNGHDVSVTAHDPPRIGTGLLSTQYRIANAVLSRVENRIPSLPARFSGIASAKCVYVLSDMGRQALRRVVHTQKIATIPFPLTVTQDFIVSNRPKLVYTGFIGPAKGLDYALELHSKLLLTHRDLEMVVIGAPPDDQNHIYLEALKQKYNKNVTFSGYLEFEAMSKLLNEGNILVLPTKDYRLIKPVSANILRAMAHSSVVVTTRANANSELITDARDGYFLNREVTTDLRILQQLLDSRARRRSVILSARKRISQFNNPIAVSRQFVEVNPVIGGCEHVQTACVSDVSARIKGSDGSI